MFNQKTRSAIVPIIALSLAACGGRGSQGSNTSPQAAATGLVCATVLSTNDTHGQLVPRTFRRMGEREVGGSAVLGAYFGAIRDTSSCPVFLFSGGDIMQGTPVSNLLEGVSTIAAFNELDYDAAALGNHEFDWGIIILRQRMEQADFPILGANVYERATGEHPEWLSPTAVVERQGVRIGVVGLATRSTPTSTRPWNVSELEFRPVSEALNEYVPQLRAQGVHFVVATMHAGGFCRSDEGCGGEAFDEVGAAAELPDYVVTGHTHSHLEQSVRGVPIIQSRSSTAAFGVGRMTRTAGGEISAHIVDIVDAYADQVTPDPDLVEIVGNYVAQVADISERLIAAEIADDLPRVSGGQAGYPLGRLIADAQRGSAGTQIAIMNNGGIRTDLAAGQPTFGDLFSIQPFGNVLVRLTVSGSVVLAALEHALEDGDPDAHISGIVARYDPAAGQGSRVLSAVLTDGQEVVTSGSYTVVVNDFMAGGGSGFTMFEDAEELKVTGTADLDALIAWIEAAEQPVVGPSDPRWVAAPGGSNGSD
ncbi:MAG: 5'-nucleotidase C-terminal domain-containing protein [Gemmatimonadota bacterium]